MAQVIDRRLDGRNKSAVNRERFIRRYKEQLRKAVSDMVSRRSIRDIDQGGDVNLPAKDITEPNFHHGQGGDREFILPGNREYTKGDAIDRPQDGAGSGRRGAGSGESTDDFTFSLSRDEFLSIFFDDLELPELARTALGSVELKKFRRAGYVLEGSPSNFAVVRTLKTALGRRIALTAALETSLEQASERLVEARQAHADEDTLAALAEEIESLRERVARVPFLDTIDMRYRHRVAVPMPSARAVMFCLMDVSASMDETKKDLAKRFFSLLYLFLSRKYEHVDIVFVRHTEDAEEVDEETFFYDRKSGGTIVQSALALTHKIITERYATADWNIYAAQASDGDAFGADAARSARFLRDKLLPLVRHFAYVETPEWIDTHPTSLWVEYDHVAREHKRLAMRRVADKTEIYPVFHDLFKKQTA